jgi:hypothetical protein
MAYRKQREMQRGDITPEGKLPVTYFLQLGTTS